jgi:60 kDa SS-A/Ro ribonucleoprotein
MLGQAVKEANEIPCDRLIVITDEQAHDEVPQPKAQRAYMVNVASNKNGVGYGAWNHIDGFSESFLRWIGEFEREFV